MSYLAHSQNTDQLYSVEIAIPSCHVPNYVVCMFYELQLFRALFPLRLSSES